jgi:hypothetical protein
VGNPLAGQSHDRDPLFFARLEAHRRACGNTEPEAQGLLAVEPECVIGFEKMTVGTDLNGPIARILHQQLLCRSAFERLNVSGGKQKLTWHDRLG